ncbi:MAG: patatin-like phospholipase family protein [Actinomycetales bacterium]
MGYLDRVDAPGRKKLLALDGGGIRGVLTLEILRSMEQMLRSELDRPDLVLGDYFDYIAGTSTGAIIAAGLAKGMTADDLQTLYVKHGQDMFDHAFLLERWRSKYQDTRLRKLLQRTLGPDTTLGDPDLRSLLMIVLRNATTDSPWPLSNNPRGKYNDRARPDCNLNLPLWQLVRASTAAPTFFPPEQVSLGRDFLFVDGGVTMHNNPSFQLFLMATHPAYRLGWPTGQDNMLVVSVGTGAAAKADDNLKPGQMNVLFNATSIPAALMSAASNEQDLLCRVFGDCRYGAWLDSEVQDLREPRHWLAAPYFTYVRYNADLTRSGLAQLGLGRIRPEDVQRMDSIKHIEDLRAVGGAASASVDPAHFAGFLDR